MNLVADPLDGQMYMIMHYPNSSKYYSWKNNDGSDGIFTGNNKKDGQWSGYWQAYTLPEVKYAQTLSDLSTGIGTVFAGTLAVGAAGITATEFVTGAQLQVAGEWLFKREAFGWNSVANGTADFTFQLLYNKGDIKKVNFTSTLAYTAMSNPLGATIFANVFDFRWDGKFQLPSTKPRDVLDNITTGTIGAGLGGASGKVLAGTGMGAFGTFSGAFHFNVLSPALVITTGQQQPKQATQDENKQNEENKRNNANSNTTTTTNH